MQAISDGVLGLHWDQEVTGNHASSCKKCQVNNPALGKSQKTFTSHPIFRVIGRLSHFKKLCIRALLFAAGGNNTAQ